MASTEGARVEIENDLVRALELEGQSRRVTASVRGALCAWRLSGVNGISAIADLTAQTRNEMFYCKH
jgi:hypothetical protein